MRRPRKSAPRPERTGSGRLGAGRRLSEARPTARNSPAVEISLTHRDADVTLFLDGFSQEGSAVKRIDSTLPPLRRLQRFPFRFHRLHLMNASILIARFLSRYNRGEYRRPGEHRMT
jgi:hypothetical protein